jgi:serine/threonine-protein kinase
MLAPGTKLGRYEIRSKIGEGGMGEVYLAQDTDLNRTVAIKILAENVAANEQRLRRFVQEAQAASGLNHPHILTIHEIGNSGNVKFIATEFIEGKTLRQIIRSSSQKPVNEVLEIAIQTASALAAAHAAGIVHRDIKPENLMIRSDGYVKVLDFGLAKLTETNSSSDPEGPTRAMVNTLEGMIMGTATYMSPEQAKGLDLDARTDLWSLGVVLYELITGKGPFVGETATDSISLILQTHPAPLTRYAKDLPAELERIVNKALTKNREERYQTAKDFLIDLRALKRKLEVDAEFDRARSMELINSDRPASNSTATTAATDSDTVTSSAEYVVNRIRKHKIAALVAALLVMAAVVAISWYIHIRNSEVAIESIAVLPFQNRSPEPDTEYLSDGLAESLIYRLSQLPNLRVSPTSSVLRYKDKQNDPIEIGNDLGVNAVLSGRIVQRGENLTISAELVDVRNKKLLWGEQYERKISEVLQTQREIAREIVDKLKLKVSRDEKAIAKHYTENNEAYQLYMRGRFYWSKRTAQALHKSVEYYEQAIQQDPNFALAYAGLADTYALLGGPEAGGDMSPIETLPKAKTAALKAIELDPTLAEPHVSLGHLSYFYDRDWQTAEREFKHAIELNPNYPVAHHWYAIFLSTSPPRLPQALIEIRRALELDPNSLIINAWYGRILGLAGQLDQAVEQLRKTLELDPNFILAHYRLGQAYAEKQMYGEAIDEFNKTLDLPDGKAMGLMGLAYANALAGKQQESQKFLDELLELSKHQYVSPGQIGIIYIARGEKEKAFERLEEANRVYDLNILRLKVERRFDPIRSDPRFDDLVKRIGIP